MLNSTKPVQKKLPGMIDSKRLLTMLFGEETVCTLRKTPLTQAECAIVATYQDNSRAVKRLVVCDLAFVNSSARREMQSVCRVHAARLCSGC